MPIMSRLTRHAAVTAAAACVGLTLACAGPAADTEAAPRAAAVSDYSAGENPRDIGDWPAGTIWIDRTYAHKRWDVPDAVRHVRAKTGLDVRVLPTGSTACYSPAANCVSVSSDRSNDTGPTGKRLGEVSLWSESRALFAADISLDDRDGAKASAAKRRERLRYYLIQAAGR